MILALRTGWTPDVIAELPTSFRESTHWALYSEGFAERYGQIATIVDRDPPRELKGVGLTEFIANRKSARTAFDWLKKTLFPADEPTDG